MRKIIFILLWVLFAGSIMAKDITYTYEGQTVKYTIISTADKTVSTKKGTISSNSFTGAVTYNYGNNISGDLILPSIVYDGDDAYTLVSIAECSFCKNLGLKSVIIPEGVTSVDNYAFYLSSALETVELPETVETIGRQVFNSCSSLVNIEIPSKVTSIGSYAFGGTSIQTVNIPRTLTKIDENTFTNCSYLTTLFIPGNISSVGRDAFYNCTSLNSITIEDGVKSLGTMCFERCSSLTSISIPPSVESIYYDTFDKCSALEELIIEDGETDLNYVVSNYNATLKDVPIKKLYMGRNITTNPFDEIVGTLEDLTIGKYVTTINSKMFKGCTLLTTLRFPASLKSIGSSAFDGCTSISVVLSESITPPTLGSSAFVSSPKRKVLYVPMGSKSAYDSSSWKNYFESIVDQSPLNIITYGEGNVHYENEVDVIDNELYYDNSISFIVLPNDGNKVGSVLLNGDDITGSIKNHILTISDYSEESTGELEFYFVPDDKSEAKLTVMGMDSHVATFHYNIGDKAKIAIEPNDGWYLYSLKFNDEDVTNNVVDNIYTTPTLNADNMLEVIMSSNLLTDVEKVQLPQRKISIKSNGNFVEFEGLEEGELITVTDNSGIVRYSGQKHSISLNTNQIYILSTEQEVLKFAL